jgi:hypothetical protein
MSLKVGDKTRLSKEGRQNESYSKWKNKTLIVTDIARSKEEHIGYDSAFNGLPLYSFKFLNGKECPNSLYGYEIEGGEF